MPEDEENTSTVTLDKVFVDLWRKFLGESLGELVAGESVWLMDPGSARVDDFEANATLQQILGIWQWDLVNMRHTHRGAVGDISIVNRVAVLTMNDDRTGKIESKDASLGFELDNAFTPKG
jgi:hypothetical protein